MPPEPAPFFPRQPNAGYGIPERYKSVAVVNTESLASAFLHCKDRKVDKAGCISFMGKKYEVGLLYASGARYRSFMIRRILRNHRIGRARAMQGTGTRIGEQAGRRPSLPDHLLPETAETSRLSQGAKRSQEERNRVQAHAVAYRNVRKEVTGDV